MTRWKCNLPKTYQAIAVLLDSDDTKEMSYLRVLKLLYITDRESIKRTGHPIMGGKVVAMRHGPVFSTLYDFIKSEDKGLSEYFRKHGHRLEMVKHPGDRKLSRPEIRLLKSVCEENRDKGEWDLSELTHTFPEWKANEQGDSSKEIPMRDILAAVGRLQDEEAILREIEVAEAADLFFSKARVAK